MIDSSSDKGQRLVSIPKVTNAQNLEKTEAEAPATPQFPTAKKGLRLISTLSLPDKLLSIEYAMARREGKRAA